MKVRLHNLIKLTFATLLTYPAFVVAVPSTSPYYTDSVNNYVQDQVSKDMEELNSFLCLINAMAPDQLVNEPDYIAMVSLKACRPNTASSGRGEGNASTGSSYLAVQLKSSRISNTSPMLTKIWLDDYIDGLTNTAIKVPMYSSASQAPSKTLPYGVFRLDYCKQFPLEANCNKHIGYINATNKGLAFYTRDYLLGSYGEYYNEFALKLGANTSTNTGSGIVIKTNTNNSIGSVTTSAIVFAHNPDFFTGMTALTHRNVLIAPAARPKSLCGDMDFITLQTLAPRRQVTDLNINLITPSNTTTPSTTKVT